MAADPIIHCLQELTDYAQFERLCSDIMAGSGYPKIEPLGGSGDRGRDAIYIDSFGPTRQTVFAYSVRADWRQKLLDDCNRLREEGHQFQCLTFVCTRRISTSQKDAAKEIVRSRFGWDLTLYDLERLRIELAGPQRHLVAKHPSIFCPPWFAARGGISISPLRDTLVIDHVAADHALAAWLARRLQLAGYHAWCFGTAPMAGETADESVRLLIENRATRYLPILSASSTADSDLLGRCSVASGIDGLTIPCRATPFDSRLVPTKVRVLQPARFDQGWSTGLDDLLSALSSQSVPANLDKERAKEIALHSFLPETLIKPSPEKVLTNVFQVSLPSSVLVCNLESALDEVALRALEKEWAFIEVSPKRLLSFVEPPVPVPLVASQRLAEHSWSDAMTIAGVPSSTIVKRLIRANLNLACHRAGLTWCSHRNVFYFPHSKGPQRRARFIHIDRRTTYVAVTGEKSFGPKQARTSFRYQLSPSFVPGRDEEGQWWVTLRLYVRITDQDGTPIEGKGILRRRKAVTKSWWNKEWLARTLAVMQSLAQGANEIEIGDGVHRVAISAMPLTWDCPISIDVEAVDRVGDFQEEMAAVRFEDDESDDITDAEEVDDER